MIVDAINEEKSDKKGRKKYKEKGTILKGQEEKTAEEYVLHMLLKRDEFLPSWPSLSFLHSIPCLF